MANPIVTVNVTQTVAPAPSNLQRTGAIISSGGTNLTPGSHALLQSPDDLAQYLPQPKDLTTLAWSSAYGGQVTGTAAEDHGVTNGTQFAIKIEGTSPSGYNGTFWAISTGDDGFIYYLPHDPGVQTVAGKYSGGLEGELRQQVDTFFAQGFQQSVYVLELGNVDVAEQVDLLKQTINDSAQMFYSYLVPRAWDNDSAFMALIAQYQNTTGKTYFFVTTKLNTYMNYTTSMKDVVTMIEAPTYGAWPQVALASASWNAGVIEAETVTPNSVRPGDWFQIIGATPAALNGVWQARPGTTGTALLWEIGADPGAITTPGILKSSVFASKGMPPNEFSMAAAWWITLSYNPSAASRVPPYAYSRLYGVTRFPSQGNGPLFSTLKAANVNIVGYGSEGGISDTILMYGHTMDGRPFGYWYSVDWMQINIDLDISNAIINGSNTTINPLYYNQDGINRLEAVAAQTGSNAIAYGMALGSARQVQLDPVTFTDNINKGVYAGQLVVNAIPFVVYTAQHPSHYAIGEYHGLSMVYTPLRGFEHIVFNINVTDFVAAAA